VFQLAVCCKAIIIIIIIITIIIIIKHIFFWLLMGQFLLDRVRIDCDQKVLLLCDKKQVPVKHELHEVADGKQCWTTINRSEQLQCIHSLDRNYLLKLKVIYIYMHAPFFFFGSMLM